MTEGTAESMSSLELLLEGIQCHIESAILKQRLDKCHSNSVQHWRDKNSLDLLHHCILNNNLLAVVLFFSRGLFKPPHEPSTWPYLHLLSCLGYRAIITTVIQELRYQNRSIALEWKTFDIAIKPKMESTAHNFREEDKSKKLTPIDLASLFGHFSCVQLLLDFWQFQNSAGQRRKSKSSLTSSSLYLSLACQADSPPALRLMLERHDDKKEALEYAIRMASAECVDVVLRDKASKLDVKSAFQGMNLYHVLYSYSRCSSHKQLEAMVEVTSVLIFHKQDVNSSRPSRTFPLHSLLNKSFVVGVCVKDVIPSLTSTLLVLLKAGADPNFDEIVVEKHVHDKEYSTAFGRKPYSSATNCLINSVVGLRGKSIHENTQDRQYIEKYSYNCLELLLRHGADLSHLGKFSDIGLDDELCADVYHTGTSLHAFFSTRKVNYPSYPFLRLLLHYGINADEQGHWENINLDHPITFALNILPFSVWTINNRSYSSDSESDENSLNENDLKLFGYTMKFMSLNALQKSFNEFNKSVDNLRSNTSQTEKDELEANHLSGNPIYWKMVEAYNNNLCQPWSLQRCCSRVIWMACRLHMGNVFSLPIPTPLRNVVMHFH